jgi:hypothetical protein
LFQAPGGGLGIIWLDGRATGADPPPADGGSIGLWAAMFDRDARQTSETAIDARACECCQTSVAETSEGVIVAYRDRSADEVRDIHLSRLVEGRWTAPALVSNDGWTIDGCPVNGPAVAASGRDVAVAWFTGATGEGRAFVAFSRDAGRTFDPPIPIDDGSATGHVDAELLADGAVAVSWTEFVNEQPHVRLRRIEPNGTRSAATTIGVTTGAFYPRLAQGRNELIVAWTETENLYSRVRTARVALNSEYY